MGDRRVLRRLGGAQHLVLALVGRHPDARVIARPGCQRVDGAGGRVHGHDRTLGGEVLAVRMGDRDSVANGALGDLLKVRVDVQLQRVAALGNARQVGRADRVTGGVEALRHLAVDAPQVGVVRPLDAASPNGAVGVEMLAAKVRVLQVGGLHLGDIAEHVGRHRPHRVVALEGLHELHPAVAGHPLLDVLDLVQGDRRVDRHRIAGVHQQPAPVLVVEPAERHLQHVSHPCHDIAPRLGPAIGGVMAPVALAVGRLGQRGGVDLKHQAGRVADQRVIVAIDDRPPLREDRRRPDLVCNRRLGSLSGVQHLERPEPEEQHPEQHGCDHAERRRAQGERQRIGLGLAPRRWRFQEHSVADRVGTDGEVAARG